MSSILLIEDDQPLVKALRQRLTQAGHRVLDARNGESGVHTALREQPDLVILDIELPAMSGFEVCEELRRMAFDRPILMLSGRNHVTDRVTGLSAGADDYLTKPFEVDELLARLDALQRRVRREHAAPLVMQFGDLRVDLDLERVSVFGKVVKLTKTEFALLALLARNAGRPVSRKTILNIAWGYTSVPNTRTVDTHVWRLRKKLGDSGPVPHWITLVPGKGYCLPPADSPGQAQSE